MARDRYWIWLSRCKAIGTMTAWRLLREVGDPESIYYTDRARLDSLGFLSEKEKDGLMQKSLTEADMILECCMDLQIFVLTPDSPAFPARLRAIPDPPVVLYGKGRLPDVDNLPCVGIVGTRKCTDYGMRTASRIAFEYARCGGTVITGLARGVDTAAAQGALMGGGKVIGVLGCGVDVVYPAENRRVFEDVCRNGALLSEYIPHTRPLSGQFPQRNRLISGLAQGILVVEAPKHSGALITAGKALEQGRDVFSVPGNVDADSCRGSNAILREGASPITSGFDLADEYRPRFPWLLSEETCQPLTCKPGQGGAENKTEEEKSETVSHIVVQKSIDKEEKADYIDRMQRDLKLNTDERGVVKCVGFTAISVDDIVEQSGLNPSRVLRALTMLQLKGYVTEHGGKCYTLKKK